MTGAPRYLLNDLDKDTARKWAAKLTATPNLDATLANDAYSALHCAYLVLDAQKVLTKEFQEWMIRMRNFTIYHAPAGHSPQLSWTTGLAEKLMEFANRILASYPWLFMVYLFWF
jgi:hypothetical protein